MREFMAFLMVWPVVWVVRSSFSAVKTAEAQGFSVPKVLWLLIFTSFANAFVLWMAYGAFRAAF